MLPVATEPSLAAPARRTLTLAIATALITGACAVIGAYRLGLPLRDPDGFLGPAWLRMPLIVAVALVVDIVPRAARKALAAGSLRRLPAAAREVATTRWPLRRLLPVVLAVASFYVTYVAYRNLKNFLPFVHQTSEDLQLAHVDRILTFGHNPAALLHGLLGTGVTAHVLSTAYTGFLVFVPISVAASLIWSKHLSHGLWYVSALCLNWALGAASYYIIPASGPFYALPWDFATLPHTGAGSLQVSLVRARVEVLADPNATSAVSGVAAFASLHVSVIFTAALIVQLTSTRALFRYAMWIYFVLVAVSTVYFGWHYLADDIAGLFIGSVSVVAGAWATGHLRSPQRRASVPAVEQRAGSTVLG
jgi:membrane-associated phospholipid phosphatase